MTKGIKRNLLALLAIVLLMGTILAACGSGSEGGTETAPTDESNTSEEGTTTEPAPTGEAEQIFRMNIATEPPSLDPAQAQDQTSFTVMIGLYEGLTRMNANGEPVPAVAESWETSEDGKTWTFKIRQDAKWSNGDPVTAHDFEYSWKRTLDPNLNPPAPYAYQLYYIQNAAEYNDPENSMKDPAQVGVKALDDHTLEVKLVNPTPYFLSLTSFFTYYPVHKATVEANPAWATDAASFVGNGAFTIAEWTHNDSMKLVKNENYFAKDEIKLAEVHMAMISEAQTELNLYNTGELDWAGGPNGEIPTEQIPVLKNDPEANLQIKGIASTYYMNFNNQKAPFNNVKVRKALSMAVNRQLLIDKITLGNQQPAYGFVSTGIKGANGEFRSEVDDKQYFQEDLEAAKQLWAEGIAEANWDPAQGFTLLHNTSEGHRKIATALADMWKTAFGVEVKIEEQEWAVFLQNRTALNYDVARAGWGADYNDPMTFIDMFTSTSGNNDLGFSNAEYDQLVKDAYATQDNAKRMEYMAKAEKILIGDNMALLPLYYYTRIFMSKPYVKDVVIDYSGNMDFTRGYIEAH